MSPAEFFILSATLFLCGAGFGACVCYVFLRLAALKGEVK